MSFDCLNVYFGHAIKLRHTSLLTLAPPILLDSRDTACCVPAYLTSAPYPFSVHSSDLLLLGVLTDELTYKQFCFMKTHSEYEDSFPATCDMAALSRRSHPVWDFSVTSLSQVISAHMRILTFDTMVLEGVFQYEFAADRGSAVAERYLRLHATGGHPIHFQAGFSLASIAIYKYKYCVGRLHSFGHTFHPQVFVAKPTGFSVDLLRLVYDRIGELLHILRMQARAG